MTHLQAIGYNISVAGVRYTAAVDVRGRMWLCLQRSDSLFLGSRGKLGRHVLVPSFGPVDVSTRLDPLAPTNIPYIKAGMQALAARQANREVA